MFDPDRFAIEFYDSAAPTVPLTHSHNSFEIDLYVYAKLNIFVKDNNYAIRDHDLLWIDDHTIHKVVYPPSERYARYVLNFSESFLQPALAAFGWGGLLEEIKASPARHLHLHSREYHELLTLFEDLLVFFEKAQEEPRYESAAAALLLALLVRLLQLFQKARGAELSQTGLQVQKIIRYLDENTGRGVTMDELERVFYLNKYYISHAFREVTGLSVGEYLQHRRILEAQTMLTKTDKPILAVALDCGFNTLQNFYKTFKKVSGMTPLHYRNTYRPG